MTKVDSLYKLFKKRPKAAERVEKTAEAWGQQKHDSRYREIKALQCCNLLVSYNPIYFNHFATTLALNRPPPKAFLIFHRLVRRLMYLPTTLSFLLISLLSSLLLSSSSLSSTALTLIWHTIRGSVVKSSQGFCSWLCPFWPLDLTRADILSYYWYHCNGLEAKSKFKTTNTKVPAHQTNIRTAPWNIANLIQSLKYKSSTLSQLKSRAWL